jgi:prolyl 4-hydroxylase
MSFIETYYIDDLAVCDELISFFNYSDDKHIGLTAAFGESFAYNPTVKDSIDVSIIDYAEHPVIRKYIGCLDIIIKRYIEKYEFCNWYSPWNIVEPINIQYYKPGGGYKQWHTERTNNKPITSARHLVFMTFLNDVTDAGETEFYYQKLKFQPKKGLTVIWPADWTHTHRGIVSMTQEKYIITGWLNYIDRN